jgi:hypothetical protein
MSTTRSMNGLDEQTAMEAREELRLRLIEAEAALKEAEIEYALYMKQLNKYHTVIREQREIILAIKRRMDSFIN